MSRRRERSQRQDLLRERLVSEHARLDAEATELDHQLHRTAAEQRRLQELKKAKLRAKDKLREL